MLAVMAFLLLVAQSGLVDSPACGMSDLVQSVSITAADPCPGPDNEQLDNANAIKVHTCDCGALISLDYPLDVAVTLLLPHSFVFLLQPFTAVLKPPAPPPRFI